MASRMSSSTGPRLQGRMTSVNGGGQDTRRHQSSIRQTTTAPAVNSVMATRIADKQAELDNLIQLRDLSATLAKQMEALESKLSHLADGTESKCFFFFFLYPLFV